MNPTPPRSILVAPSAGASLVEASAVTVCSRLVHHAWANYRGVVPVLPITGSAIRLSCVAVGAAALVPRTPSVGVVALNLGGISIALNRV